MHKIKVAALALAILSVAGCKIGGNDTDNSDPEPIIKTPERSDVSIQATFPSNYFVAQSLEIGHASAFVDLFVGYGYSFDVPEEVAELFIAGGAGSMTANVMNDNLMLAEAFNPDTGHYMGALVGFNTSDIEGPVSVDINPVSDAIADLTLPLEPDVEGGLEDDFQRLDLADVLRSSAQSQLVLEGFSESDAGNASDVDLQSALDRLLVADSSALDAADGVTKQILEGTYWNGAGVDASLSFSDGTTTYIDSSGNVYPGTYNLIRDSGVSLMRMDFGALGMQDVSLEDYLSGTGTLNLVGQDFNLAAN